MRIPLILAIGLIFLTGSGLARADWLDDVWSKSTALRGNPAITVHPGGVTVVLPAETFDQAFAEQGMTRPDVLRAFLDRYSPQCSSVLNLNTAQPNLAVELRIQVATTLDGAPAQNQDEMLAAMETIAIPSPKEADAKGTGKGRHAQIPRIAQVFTTSPERFDFSIDYAPDKIVHCVVPQDPSS